MAVAPPPALRAGHRRSRHGVGQGGATPGAAPIFHRPDFPDPDPAGARSGAPLSLHPQPRPRRHLRPSAPGERRDGARTGDDPGLADALRSGYRGAARLRADRISVRAFGRSFVSRLTYTLAKPGKP